MNKSESQFHHSHLWNWNTDVFTCIGQGGMQTSIKTWMMAGNVERLSEASVSKDATCTVHAIHPSLRGTFLYWMQPVTSTVDVPYWEQNKPWLSLVYPSYFPTLHTADNSSWAVFTYLPAQKKSSLLVPNQSVHKTRLWVLSWASFDQAMKIDKRTGSVPDPSLRIGEFSVFELGGRGGGLVGSSHGGHRIAISRREADSHLIGFAWHCLTEFCWRNSNTCRLLSFG